MKTRLLTILVVLTALMQIAILYRQPRPPRPQPPIANAPDGVYFDLVDFPIEGKLTANTVLVEFSDFECPFCKRHATTVLPTLMERFVERGVVRYAMANNPLAIHPKAKWLAQVAMCAGEQGRYWETHAQLFSANRDSEVNLGILASQVPLDAPRLGGCIERDSTVHERIIKRDQELAGRLGLVGTPAFAVGRLESGNRVHVRKIIRGAVPVEVFTEAIEDVSAPSARNAAQAFYASYAVILRRAVRGE